MTDRDEQMVTWRDVSALLQVDVKTLRRMVEDGDFPPPVPVRGSDRWTLGEVRKWQLEQRILATVKGKIVDTKGQSGTSAPQADLPPSKPPKPR